MRVEWRLRALAELAADSTKQDAIAVCLTVLSF
jgi:hypothetical protein